MNQVPAGGQAGQPALWTGAIVMYVVNVGMAPHPNVSCAQSIAMLRPAPMPEHDALVPGFQPPFCCGPSICVGRCLPQRAARVIRRSRHCPGQDRPAERRAGRLGRFVSFASFCSRRTDPYPMSIANPRVSQKQSHAAEWCSPLHSRRYSPGSRRPPPACSPRAVSHPICHS